MSAYFPIILLFIIVLIDQRNERMNFKKILRNRKKKGLVRMNELINSYLGKDCIVYISGGSSVTGIISELNSNWITIKTKDGNETVNLDYIVRIKEYPLNKNGKKKSIVF